MLRARLSSAVGIATALIAAVGLASCGKDNKPAISGADTARLQGQLDAVVKAGVPGVSAEILTPGGAKTFTAGVADVENRKPVMPADRFRIASMAKAFNGAAVLALVGEGKLGLDDRLGDRLPGLMPKAEAVTVRQMLGHTGGLPDYTKQDSFRQKFGSNPAGFLSPRDLIGFVSKLPLEFPPGSRYQYSDTDNIVLGLLVESLTHRSYAADLTARIFKPLGLTATSLPVSPPIHGPHVNGYQYEDPGGKGKLEDLTTVLSPSGAWASGGMVSAPHDMTRFISALLGGRLYPRKLLADAQRTVAGSSSPAGPGTNRAGLALFSYQIPCGTVWGHTGTFPGYRGIVAASQDGKRAVTVLVNATQVSDRAERLILRAQQTAICLALK